MRARRTHVPIVTALLVVAALLGGVPAVPAQEGGAPGNAAAAPAPDLTPLAGGAESGAAPARPAPVVSTGDFLRMVVVLAAVLGVVYLLVLLIKRSSRVRLGDGSCIALLGSRSLGGSRSLHLVQVGSGVYLVGATDQALNLIAEVTDQNAIDAVQPDHSRGNGSGRRFSDLLADIGTAPGGTPGAATGTVPRPAAKRAIAAGADFLHHQQERLRRRPQEADGAPD